MDRYKYINNLNIAICDDEEIVHKKVGELLKIYGEKEECKIKELHFYNAAELLRCEDKIDILLLDINMPQIDGIETGKRLIEQKKNYRIIVLTGLAEKAIETYKIGAFRFVVKPLDDGKELFEAITDAISTFFGCEKIEVKYCYKSIYIYQYQIEYIKSGRSYLHIYTDNMEYESTKTLKDILAELDSRLFIKTDKSHIVNLANIKSIYKNKILLTSGTEIPISRRLYKEVIENFNKYDAKGFNRLRNGFFE